MKIEKGIPVCGKKSKGGRPPKYPFGDMEVGDSILVDGSSASYADCPGNNAATQYARRHGVKFSARTVENGKVRIWRVA